MKDINEFYIFHSKRHTNPLSPRYRLADENKKVIEYGDVRGNKPAVRHPKNPQRLVSFDLKSEDIEGAQADTAFRVTRGYKTRETVNKTDDIPGARASSLKKGLQTNRVVEPLRPVYALPGHSEMPADFSQNPKPVSMVKGHSRAYKEGSKSVDVQAKIAGYHTAPNENNIAFYDNSTQIEPNRAKLTSSDKMSDMLSQKSGSNFGATVQSNGGGQENENRQLHSNLLSSAGEKSLAKQNQITTYKRNSVGGDRGLISSRSEFQRDAAKFHGYEPNNTLKSSNKGNSSLSSSQQMPAQTVSARVSEYFF